MNRKMREVQEKRPFPVPLDKLQGFIGQPVGQVIARSIFQVVQLERGMVTGLGPTLIPAGHLHIKALLQWAGRIFSQMPLAEVARGIAMFPQRFGQSDFGQW